MPITAFYAAILAPIYIFLTMQTVAGRKVHKVPLGDGGHADLQQRIRRHGNFAEYVPFGLVLLGLAESLGTALVLLHAGALALLVGRVLHALALTPQGGVLRLRVAGMALTMFSFGTLALANLYGALGKLL